MINVNKNQSYIVVLNKKMPVKRQRIFPSGDYLGKNN